MSSPWFKNDLHQVWLNLDKKIFNVVNGFFFHYFVDISPFKRAWPFIETTWILFFKRCLSDALGRLVEIGTVVLEMIKIWKVHRQPDNQQQDIRKAYFFGFWPTIHVPHPHFELEKIGNIFLNLGKKLFLSKPDKIVKYKKMSSFCKWLSSNLLKSLGFFHNPLKFFHWFPYS